MVYVYWLNCMSLSVHSHVDCCVFVFSPFVYFMWVAQAHRNKGLDTFAGKKWGFIAFCYTGIYYPRSQAYPVFFFFVLQFVFSIIHGGGRARKWGRPGNTCHVDDVWWMRGGRRGGGPTTNSCAINRRASFLPVKSSTVIS